MKKLPYTFKYQPNPELRKIKNIKKEDLNIFPYLPVRFYSKNERTPVIEAILDSGADYIYVHKDVVESLGLPKGEKIEASGMGGKYDTYETEIGLIIGRGGREYDLGYVKAYFPEIDQKVPILIGRHPVFEEYQIIF